MLLPHYYIIVIIDGLDCSLCKFNSAWHEVRNHAESTRTECLGLRNHRPEKLASNILFHKLTAMSHCNEFDRMGMEGCAVW